MDSVVYAAATAAAGSLMALAVSAAQAITAEKLALQTVSEACAVIDGSRSFRLQPHLRCGYELVAPAIYSQIATKNTRTPQLLNSRFPLTGRT